MQNEGLVGKLLHFGLDDRRALYADGSKMKKLSELLVGLTYEIICGSFDKEITGVVYDSRKIIEDALFICISGAKIDGHDFIEQVVEKKAAVVLVEKEVAILKDCNATIIKVEDTRYAMAFISAAFFGHPAKELKIIGITGTKGKTTTTYLVKTILEQAGHRVGLIGTIETIIGETHIPANNTTPESYILQQTFREMADASIDTVVMEVSSQGLMMHRTQGFVFDIGIFTNIEPDHIGPNEHVDFDDYLRCKGLLFKQCKIGIVNCDDKNWEKVIEGNTCEIKTFGFSEEASLRAENEHLISGSSFLGVMFHATGLVDCDITLHSPGKFSIYNAMAAIAICHCFSIDQDIMKEALLHASVKGRIELIKVSDQFTLLIDYAHNAMSLKSLLITLKEYQPKRLVCLFGCGGNRSKLRRLEMGEVSGTYADITIITSDNPRDEEPLAIMADIRDGISKTTGTYLEICDRKEAIAYVIKNGQPGDVIVLAGKGHEDYQEIKGVKYHLDEREVIADIIKENK